MVEISGTKENHKCGVTVRLTSCTRTATRERVQEETLDSTLEEIELLEKLKSKSIEIRGS